MKIAIALHGQAGDLMTAMSVLKFKDELWGSDCEITWFADKNNFDLLAYHDIEVKEFPRGFGYPEMVVEENKKLVDKGEEPIWHDWKPLVNQYNKMSKHLQGDYPELSEYSEVYFPAPHQVPIGRRSGLNYPVVSKKVFGIPDEYEWHPVLKFSDEDRQRAKDFMDSLPQGVKNIFCETFAGSSQSILDEAMNERNMWICRQYWKDCNFIFGSHKFLRGQEQFPDKFFEREGVYSCSDFTVRQTALISGKCDLILSVSSGLTVAASCWENMEQEKIPTVIQYTGSEICSTLDLYKPEYFTLVTADYKSFEKSKDEFHEKLIHILNRNL